MTLDIQVIKYTGSVMKHSVHLATENFLPIQNMDNTLCLGAGKHWLMIPLYYYQWCSYITLNFVEPDDYTK
jgi:hypothetical protein